MLRKGSALSIFITAACIFFMFPKRVFAELRFSSAETIPLTVSAVNRGIAEISVSNAGMITPLKAGDNGYWKVAAFILIFGIMLLGALLVRKHRSDR